MNIRGLIVTGLLCLSASAFAHSWYDTYCCNDGDCAPIPASSVTPTDDGWVITLKPGDHPMVTEPITHTFKYVRTRQSQDDQFHLCLYPTQHEVQCFYAPPFGV